MKTASVSAALARRRRSAPRSRSALPPARPVRSSGRATPTTWPARSRARSRPPPRGAIWRFWSWLAPAAPRLAKYDLAASRVLWTQPADVTTRVEVGGSVLVHGSKGTTPNGELVGRDLATGAALWQHPFPSSEHLYGYALDGDALFVVTRSTTTPSKPTGVLAAYDARTGVLRWQATLPSARVAGPAVRGGVVAVPLESQYVLLYDGATGLPLGQVLSTEEAATFVRALPEGLFYGSRGLFLLGRDTARGSRHATGYLAAQLPAFVRPTYDYDHYRPEQNEYSALDRNRVLWRVTVADGRPSFRDGLAFVHDYRFFFAFDAKIGRAPLGLRQPRGRGGLDRHRSFDPVRHRHRRDRGPRSASPARGSTRPGFRARWCGAPPSTPRGSRRRSPPRPARRPICSGR